MTIARWGNAYIERGDPQSALRLLEVWGICDRYRLVDGKNKPHPPMAKADAERLFAVLADQVDPAVKGHAMAAFGDALTFGSLPADLRPRLQEAAVAVLSGPERGPKPQALLVLFRLHNPQGKVVLQRVADADPDERIRTLAKGMLDQW
jgi:hypothetical protein